MVSVNNRKVENSAKRIWFEMLISKIVIEQSLHCKVLAKQKLTFFNEILLQIRT